MAVTTAAASSAAAVFVLRHVDPNAAGNPLPPCVFHALTGYWCPGCGMTRALHALVHGDLLHALHMNPLGMLMLLALPAMVLWSWGWQPRALQPLMRRLMEPKLWLVVLPVYWIARNLPWVPFTWLAPGGALG